MHYWRRVSAVLLPAVEQRDLWEAPLGEGLLLLILGGVGWAAHFPLLLASLGPTAFEQVERPNQRSARPYNIVVGHLIGLGVALFAVLVTHAAAQPGVLAAGWVAPERVWAAAIAAALTALFTLAARATQPAALATTLLVALGNSSQRDVLAIMVGVLILTAIGEPLRRHRARARREAAT